MTTAFAQPQPQLAPIDAARLDPAAFPVSSTSSTGIPASQLPQTFDRVMNPLPQPQPGQPRANGHNLQHRSSGDFRQRAPSSTMPPNGHAPMPVPSVAGPHQRVANGMRSGFEGARSPPTTRSTAHVPCKFFRQGTCQAGNTCPFAHDTTISVCKYFQKGNCKFGMRCANEHITADGRRVNKPGGIGGMGLGGRVMPMPVPPPPGGSLLTGQLDQFAQPQPVGGRPEDFGAPSSWKQGYGDIPNIETTFSSHPGSQYGSPPNDGRMPISPAGTGLSIRDVGLPASFDSQGISQYAKGGPIPASVPVRFGMDTSPSSSVPRFGESSAVRDLRSSAFGDARRDLSGLASSPPVAENEPIGRRIMHSERFSTRPKMISASVGAQPPIYGNDEWDDPNFALEEDLVPTSLHDLLTPQEKMRRFSRNAEEEVGLSHRLSLSGLGTPADSSSKIGSPSNASPSRFSALWSMQKPEGGSEGNLTRTSAFGHVGSPLRNSSLHPGASPSLRAVSRPTSGDVSPFVSSPPVNASMSMISQQLQRTRISDTTPSAQPQHPGISRIASGSSSVSAQSSRLDRAVSSSSSFGREKIDEEQEPFPMDDEPQPPAPAEERKKPNAWKRSSGGLWALGKASPRLGPIGRSTSGSITKDQSPWNNGA